MLRKNTFFYLNGPPSVGKDEIGKVIAPKLRSSTFGYKNRLVAIAKVMAGVNDATWDKMYEDKDTPNNRLFGLSPRKFLQVISEKMVKPILGEDYFAKALNKEILNKGRNIYRPFHPVITDCGFEKEVACTLAAFPQANHVIIRLHCEGCTFEGDTRTYLPPMANGSPNIIELEIENPRVEPELLESQLNHIADLICFRAMELEQL